MHWFALSTARGECVRRKPMQNTGFIGLYSASLLAVLAAPRVISETAITEKRAHFIGVEGVLS
jgi:hypothetical protein